MRVTIHIPGNEHKKIKRAAKAKGVSLSSYCSQAAIAQTNYDERQRAVEEVNQLIGSIQVTGNVDEALTEERKRSERNVTW
ncbi:MAG: hypothetical protein ACRCYY_03210 [Trueperaceae bacterium]